MEGRPKDPKVRESCEMKTKTKKKKQLIATEKGRRQQQFQYCSIHLPPFHPLIRSSLLHDSPSSAGYLSKSPHFRQNFAVSQASPRTPSWKSHPTFELNNEGGLTSKLHQIELLQQFPPYLRIKQRWVNIKTSSNWTTAANDHQHWKKVKNDHCLKETLVSSPIALYALFGRMYVEDSNPHGGGIATQTNEFNAFKHIVVVTYRFPVQNQRSMIQGGPRIGTNGGITPINWGDPKERALTSNP